MHRTVTARRELFGAPRRYRDALLLGTRELLQTASGDEIAAPAGDGSFLITLRSTVHHPHLNKHVRVHLGEASEDGFAVRLPLRWEAEPGRHLLPGFTGALELTEEDDRHAKLALVGQFTAPFGPVGGTLGLGPVLHEAAGRLVDGLAHALAAATYGDEALAHVLDPCAMTVGQVMSKDPLTFPEDLSLRSAASLLLIGGAAGAVVVDAEGHAVGVISEDDLLDKVAEEPKGLGRAAANAATRHQAVTAGQACRRPAPTTDTDTRVREAASEMTRHDVDRLVVMDGGVMIGVVTRHDVLKALVRRDGDIEYGALKILTEGQTHSPRCTSDGGIVHVEGTVRTRSLAGSLIRQIEAMDGVLQVIDGIRWEDDDLIPPPLL